MNGSTINKQYIGDTLSSDRNIDYITKICDSMHNFIAIFCNGEIIYINPTGVNMLGFSDEKIPQKMSFADILHSNYKDIASLKFDDLIDDDNLIVKFIHMDKSGIDIHIWVKSLDIGNNIYLLEGREITKYLKHAASAQIREQRLQSLLNAIPDCVLMLDSDGYILEANPATLDEFQISRKELHTTNISKLIPNLSDKKLSSFLDSTWNINYQNDEHNYGDRRGEFFRVELIVRILNEGCSIKYCCIIKNIENRLRTEEEIRRYMEDLEHNHQLLEGHASDVVHMAEELDVQKRKSEYQALHDPLTNLPNRRYFYNFLKQSIKNAAEKKNSICLLFIDLDKFKQVNDTLGHDVGDKLLLDVAAKLKENTRDNDMPARLGGDEFAVILNSQSMLDKEKYNQITNRIREDLYINIPNSKQQIQTSASIGAVLYPNDASSFDSLVKLADYNMYKAKKGGRNKVVFNS